MKNSKITAYYKPVGKQQTLVEIENDLQTMQKLIGGYIESYTIASDAAVICDEEGRLKGLPYNCSVGGARFYGPILLVGACGDEFCSVNKSTITLVDDWGLIR